MSSRENAPPVIGSNEYRLVIRKARQLVGRVGFNESDRADIEQQLVLRLVEGFQLFDPIRGHPHAFADAIINHAVARMMRERVAKKRDWRRVRSYHAFANDHRCEGPELIGERQYNARRMSDPRTDGERLQLVMDVADTLKTLSGEQRDLAERLKHQSIAEAAGDLGIPRTTLNDRVRKIRKRFEAAGLREYL